MAEAVGQADDAAHHFIADLDLDLERYTSDRYLQDCPSPRHGPTAFLPGTATAEAHERNEVDDMSLVDAFGPASVATVNAGDAVIYDASVLHFGAANDVPGNTRVVLYFSVANHGAAAALCTDDSPRPPGMRDVDPVPFSSILG